MVAFSGYGPGGRPLFSRPRDCSRKRVDTSVLMMGLPGISACRRQKAGIWGWVCVSLQKQASQPGQLGK